MGLSIEEEKKLEILEQEYKILTDKEIYYKNRMEAIESETYNRYSKNANEAYLLARRINYYDKYHRPEIECLTEEEIDYIKIYLDIFDKHYSKQEFLNKINNITSLEEILNYFNSISKNNDIVVQELIKKYSNLNFEEIKKEITKDLEICDTIKEQLIEIEKNIEEKYSYKFNLKDIFSGYILMHPENKNSFLSIGLIDEDGVKLIEQYNNIFEEYFKLSKEKIDLHKEIEELKKPIYEMQDKKSLELFNKLCDTLDKVTNDLEKNIIFEYSVNAAFKLPDPNTKDFVIRIFESGLFVYNEFIFRVEIENSENSKNCYLKSETIEKIKKLIDSNMEFLKSVPDFLNNGILDGDIQKFIFQDKVIETTCINDFDKRNIKEEEYDNDPKYKYLVETSSKIISIVEEIAKILEEEGHKFEFYNFDMKI